MAIILPLLAASYFVGQRTGEESEPENRRDGREKLPIKRGTSQVRDKAYLDATKQPYPYVGPNATIDELRGTFINKVVPHEDQIRRQRTVYETLRSGGVGDGGSKQFLITEK